MPGGTPQIDLDAVRKILGGNLIWIALSILVVVIMLFASIRMGEVSGEQVGVKLNKLTGSVEVIERSGVQFYNGILSDFFVLDKTLQTLDMGGAPTGDCLKVKTIDGSDVYIDLKVQYRMIPSMADEIVTSSGPDDAYKLKWARDYVRSIARNYLGELTTEEFYDSSKRDAKRLLAEKDAREQLQRFGIDIDSVVIPRRPVFYKEYEEMIRKKKVADQTVLEEQSKALAAEQMKLKLKVMAENEKNVAVETFSGEMQQRIIQAKAEADKAVKGSDAYFTRTTIASEAQLYEMQQRAEGILAMKRAEAEGIEELKKALEGEGGRNMVKLEYARKLKDVVISGQPFTMNSQTERFQHLGAPASQGAPKKTK